MQTYFVFSNHFFFGCAQYTCRAKVFPDPPPPNWWYALYTIAYSTVLEVTSFVTYRVVSYSCAIDEILIVQQVFSRLASDLPQTYIRQPTSSHRYPTPTGVIPRHDLCLDTHNKLVTENTEDERFINSNYVIIVIYV